MKFKIKGKTYTEDEAKELYLQLDKIFGKEKEYVPWPYPVEQPWNPLNPIIRYYEKNTGDPIPQFPVVTC